MRNWFRHLRTSLAKLSSNRPSLTTQLTVDRLEDRTVLTSGMPTNQAFVTALYQDLLNRAPDAGGLQAFTQALNQGTLTRLQVVQIIQASAEFHTDVVQNLYQTFLRRPADPSGLTTFTNILASGGTALQVEAIILSSAEYFQSQGGGTNQGFVTALYRDILGRAPDPGGLQTFTAALNAGVSRLQVVEVILDSPEAVQLQVTNLYEKFLNRAPDSTGLQAFTTALELGEAPGNLGTASATAGTTASAQLNTGTNASAQTNLISSASASAQQNGALTAEQATALILASPEFFSRLDP